MFQKQPLGMNKWEENKSSLQPPPLLSVLYMNILCKISHKKGVMLPITKTIFRVVLKLWSLDQEHSITGNLLDMQILSPHLKSTVSETRNVGPGNLGFNKPSRRFDAR